MDAIGMRMTFLKNKWPELNRMTEAGQMMMWGLGWISGIPDGEPFYSYLVSRNIGTSNDARLRLPAYDRLYDEAHSAARRHRAQRDIPEAERADRQLRAMDRRRLPVPQRPDAAVAARVQGRTRSSARNGRTTTSTRTDAIAAGVDDLPRVGKSRTRARRAPIALRRPQR